MAGGVKKLGSLENGYDELKVCKGKEGEVGCVASGQCSTAHKAEKMGEGTKVRPEGTKKDGGDATKKKGKKAEGRVLLFRLGRGGGSNRG